MSDPSTPQAGGAVVAPRSWSITADHPAFVGHFPDQPILPGVALLAAVLEAVQADPDRRTFVGDEPQLAVTKFLAPVRPGASLTIDWQRREQSLGWTLRDGERVAASGQLARAATTP